MKQVEIQTQTHQHEGNQCQVGDVIVVDDDTATWLIQQGVGAIVATADNETEVTNG